MATARKINIVSVWPERLWRTKQSPSRRFYIYALRELCNIVVTGPGFPDWDNSKSGVENIRRIMPECDAVLSYKALGGCDYGSVNDPKEVAENYLTIEQFNECHPGTDGSKNAMHPGGGTAAQECIRGHIKLVIIHHENDRHRMDAAQKNGSKIVHIPHCASPLFAKHAKPWKERSGVVLTGSIGHEHYPLRQRMNDLIRCKKIRGIAVSRPGNYMGSIEESDKSVEEYAKLLGSCKVKLGCSSKWKYALQHYSEAAMAGCCHVADLPDAAWPNFGGMIWPIDANSTDQEISDAVNLALEHGEERASLASSIAKSCYSTRDYANRLLACVREMA